ncbi:hypothetical protein Misp01_54090 [Microtetraspora sp. NBRC 13810]|uniref:hypothetical protein n=1 Tax=Microtetraspora sp. NBRC 13810 TaxID=3030990 RepID=UPI002553E1B2|nr:hypothetical protein [Microtetraspora sp. NBRC 13810]GLW10281.1 hypothetical protein Misp01_54090 [Microtetraspora sp. NBRC 13810]
MLKKSVLVLAFAGLLSWPAVAAHADGGDGAGRAINIVLFADEVFEPVSVPVSLCGNATASPGNPITACNRGASVVSDNKQG